MCFAICVRHRQETEIDSSESMPNLANASTEELIDNTIAGWEAANERMYRTEQMAYDLARRVSDLEAVLLEQFRDDASVISSITTSTTKYMHRHSHPTDDGDACVNVAEPSARRVPLRARAHYQFLFAL